MNNQVVHFDGNVHTGSKGWWIEGLEEGAHRLAPHHSGQLRHHYHPASAPPPGAAQRQLSSGGTAAGDAAPALAAEKA
jgi:hypothetical protein